MSSIESLEKRINNLEVVAAKFFTFFKWLIAALTVVSVFLLLIVVLWLLGVPANQVLFFCKTVLNNSIISVILMVFGFLGITVFVIVKPIQKYFHRLYYEKLVKPVIESLND